MKLQDLSRLAIVIGATITLLVVGRSLLIPLVFAIFLWFLVREMRGFLHKLPKFGKQIPIWFTTILCASSLVVVIGLFSQILLTNIQQLAKQAPKYEKNVTKVIEKFEREGGSVAFDWAKSQAQNINLGSIFESVFNGFSDVVSSAVMILLYALFLFLEERYLRVKIARVFPEKERRANFLETMEEVEDSVAQYLGLKTLISFSTGLFSYFVLLYVGIDAPIFWAFVIFLMNFIPSIGSLIGTIFPALFCLLQFGELAPFLLVLGVVGVIQVVVGNILEPRLMGTSMNVSAFVAILALSIWGLIWGIVGMALSVPITVILIIILSKFKSTKPLAILLSEKGELAEEIED